MLELYFRERSFVSRILDVSQEIKDSLTVLLEARPFGFAIDLVAHTSGTAQV